MPNSPFAALVALGCRTATCAVGFGRLLPLLAAQHPVVPVPPPPANYVAHEWGTFTSMVGADGLGLEGLHHEEEALPKFVHDLLRVDAWARTVGEKLPASHVTQKMETPVVYFYADAPLAVRAEVWFHQGLMTQFYPLPTKVYPELALARQQRLDLAKVDGSHLVWDVDVLPRSGPAPAGIPTVAADDPWDFARRTDAAYVRTKPAPGSPARAEAEHYLFYRGLGRWQPDLHLDPAAAGGATLHNRLPQAIPFALALELGPAGGRSTAATSLPADGRATFDLAAAPWEPDRARFAARVGRVVRQALLDAGLFPDEAQAMVATWSRSWFQKDGARVVYLLPREQIDAVLPLELQPRPQTLVRVMVGRLEFITPAAQARVEQALAQRSSADPTVAHAAATVLAELERFLEPHLRHVERNGVHADARAAARQLLQATAPPAAAPGSTK